jgi:hypothetical protein
MPLDFPKFNRITKIHFQDFSHCKSIGCIEAHINLVDRLPKDDPGIQVTAHSQTMPLI